MASGIREIIINHGNEKDTPKVLYKLLCAYMSHNTNILKASKEKSENSEKQILGK